MLPNRFYFLYVMIIFQLPHVIFSMENYRIISATKSLWAYMWPTPESAIVKNSQESLEDSWVECEPATPEPIVACINESLADESGSVMSSDAEQAMVFTPALQQKTKVSKIRHQPLPRVIKNNPDSDTRISARRKSLYDPLRPEDKQLSLQNRKNAQPASKHKKKG